MRAHDPVMEDGLCFHEVAGEHGWKRCNQPLESPVHIVNVELPEDDGLVCVLCKTLGLGHDGEHLPPGPVLPVLPYNPGNPSSGFSGSSTSEATARDQDADGRTKDKQVQAVTWLGRWRPFVDDPELRRGCEAGLTWRDLDDLTGWGHGSTSRVLSDLHKTGHIARLTEERNRCKVYVLPEYVNGRDTEPHGGTRSAVLAAAEAVVVRVLDLANEYEAQATPPSTPTDHALLGVAHRIRAVINGQ